MTVDACARCQQVTVAGATEVCAACRERDREPQGEAVRLFTPAPREIPGQMAF